MKQPLRLSFRYILLMLVVLGVLILIDFIIEKEPGIFANIVVTYLAAIVILVVYSAGAAFMVRRIPDEAARLTAIRIFMAIMIGIGAMLALAIWVEEPGQIFLVLGIIWGAIFISLRDLIQNFVGSLTLLVTGEYRIGDKIRIRNVFGLVMDISILRTTLMELDRESGDSPTGEIVTIPNGILFREIVINTTRHLSIVTDEIRITLPFPADLQKARELLTAVVQRYTADAEGRAAGELDRLREKKYLPAIDTRPAINLLLADRGVILIVKYVTSASGRSAIKTRIIEDLSREIPGVLKIEP